MLETIESPAAATVSDIADRLRKERAPALVVAPGEARLVAANAAGARALGLAAAPHSPSDLALDSAMPAVMQLRRFAGLADTAPGGIVEPLVFWTPGGTARMLCRISALGDTSGRRLVLVEQLDHNGLDDEPELNLPLASSDPGDATGSRSTCPPPITAADWGEEAEADTDSAANVTPPADDGGTDRAAAPPLRNDADILKAIARQILAGRSAAPRDETTAAKPARREQPAPKRSVPERSQNRDCDAIAERDVIDLDAPTSVGRTSRPAAAVDGPPRTEEPTAECTSPDDPPATDPAEGDRLHAARPRAAEDVTVGLTNEQPAAAATPPSSEAVASAKPRAGLARRSLMRRIAHELKSPLSAIAAASEIMKDERLGPIGDQRYLGYARDIHESARHALDVVQRMLGVEADATAAPQMDFTDLDLNSVVASLISTMQPLAANAGIALSTELAARLPRVVADGTSVRQIALNLVSNAMKFTPRGGSVVVTTSALVDGPLTLEITDTGPGMSADDLARLDAGDREPEIAPRRGGGFGIGLPLVRSLAHANGAELRIANRDGGGITATIVFPKSRQVLV